MNQAYRFVSYFGFFMARFVLFPFYFLSGFIPRRPDLWVFGSWGGYRFADNSASFFLYCQRDFAETVRLVWISREPDIVTSLREKGFEAHLIWSARGIWCCLTAKLHIFDSFSKDINFWPSRGASKVNLWSGVPLKAFERDIKNPRSRYYRLFHGSLPERWLLAMMMPWHVDRPNLIIATSPETGEITRRAFDLPPEAVVVTGFPRNDVLFQSAEAARSLNRDWPPSFIAAVDAKRRIFMYLPTYRDSGKPFFNLDWADLDRLMHELNATFFFKFHPDDQSTFRGTGQHIVELPIETDIYSMMAYSDALISDYSSIIFDYMLLDRPVIYYAPDMEEFVSSSRSLIFDPADIAVGPVCFTAAELKQAISDVANEVDASPERQAKWAATRKRFNSFMDGQSSRRTAEAIDHNVLDGYLGLSRIQTTNGPDIGQ